MLFNSFSLFLTYFSTVFVCFSNDLLNEQNVNLACYTILLWSEGHISSLAMYSYLSALPDNTVDV